MANIAEQENMSDIWRGGANKTLETDGSEQMPRVTIASGRSSQASQPNVLRTVYLPNEKVGQMKSGNDHLN